MKISIEIDEQQLRKIVLEYIREQANFPIAETDIKIETKSTQNYKSEWEAGAGFRATVLKVI